MLRLYSYRHRIQFYRSLREHRAKCLYSLIIQKDINHLERMQRAATRWVKGLRGLTYEERLQALKLQPLGKRRQKHDLVLTRKILYNHMDLDATQLATRVRTRLLRFRSPSL